MVHLFLLTMGEQKKRIRDGIRNWNCFLYVFKQLQYTKNKHIFFNIYLLWLEVYHC